MPITTKMRVSIGTHVSHPTTEAHVPITTQTHVSIKAHVPHPILLRATTNPTTRTATAIATIAHNITVLSYHKHPMVISATIIIFAPTIIVKWRLTIVCIYYAS